MGGKVSTLFGGASLLAAAFTIASFGLLVHSISTMFSLGAQNALRSLLAALLVGLLILFRKKLILLGKKYTFRTILVGLGGFGALSFLTIAVQHTKLATAAFFLYSTSILTSIVLGRVFFKEKLTLSSGLAILVCLSGLALYGGAGLLAISSSLGVLAGIAAGVCDSIANGVRKTLKSQDRDMVVMYQYIVSAIAGVVLIGFAEGPLVFDASAWPAIALLVLSLLSVGNGYFLLYGFTHFNMNVGSVILSSQIFFAMLLGAIFFHEYPSTNELIGGVLICIAAAMTVFDVRKLFTPKKEAAVEESA